MKPCFGSITSGVSEASMVKKIVFLSSEDGVSAERLLRHLVGTTVMPGQLIRLFSQSFQVLSFILESGINVLPDQSRKGVIEPSTRIELQLDNKFVSWCPMIELQIKQFISTDIKLEKPLPNRFPKSGSLMLAGPRGVGKATIAKEVVDQLSLKSLTLSLTNRLLLPQYAVGIDGSVDVLIIKGVDDFCKDKENEHFLKTFLDQLTCFVIATVIDIKLVPASIRRSGRFDRDLFLDYPDKEARRMILTTIQKRLVRKSEKELGFLAKRSAGCVFRDLEKVLEVDDATLDAHFIPFSSRIVGLGEVEKSLSDLVGIDYAIDRLKWCVEFPAEHVQEFRQFGIRPNRGVLIFGESGNGKTSLVRAFAKYVKPLGISVQYLRGPEMYQSLVGESEREIREIFQRARCSSGESYSMVIIDEIDSLGARRDNVSGGNEEVQNRILATLLTEMDGLNGADDRLFVVATTNKPDTLDEALIRPGRFDEFIYISNPDVEQRIKTLKSFLHFQSPETNEVLKIVAEMSNGLSIADLEQMCDEYQDALSGGDDNDPLDRMQLLSLTCFESVAQSFIDSKKIIQGISRLGDVSPSRWFNVDMRILGDPLSSSERKQAASNEAKEFQSFSAKERISFNKEIHGDAFKVFGKEEEEFVPQRYISSRGNRQKVEHQKVEHLFDERDQQALDLDIDGKRLISTHVGGISFIDIGRHFLGMSLVAGGRWNGPRLPPFKTDRKGIGYRPDVKPSGEFILVPSETGPISPPSQQTRPTRTHISLEEPLPGHRDTSRGFIRTIRERIETSSKTTKSLPRFKPSTDQMDAVLGSSVTEVYQEQQAAATGKVRISRQVFHWTPSRLLSLRMKLRPLESDKTETQEPRSRLPDGLAALQLMTGAFDVEVTEADIENEEIGVPERKYDKIFAMETIRNERPSWKGRKVGSQPVVKKRRKIVFRG